METKKISADCTRRLYRKKYASAKLYEQLKKSLTYGIIAALLILITPLLVGGGGLAVMFCVIALNLIPVIMAVLTRNRFWAVAAAVISALWMAYVLFATVMLIAAIWQQLSFFGFKMLFLPGRMGVTFLYLSRILSGVLSIRCAAKMLGVFKEIDAEYDELMANLRV